MLRCTDNSIYTGITTDLERRMSEHFSKNEKCAKYTLTHNAQKLEKVWKTENRVLASKLEFFIKTLTKNKKEKLINSNEYFVKYLNEKIDCTKYSLIDNYTIDKYDLKNIIMYKWKL